jgi:hypothetical protein
MSNPQVIMLAVQAGLFLVWGIMAFRILFQLRRRASDMTGKPFPGLPSVIEATREWLDDPETRSGRLRFFALTAALFAMSAVFAARRG